MFEPIEVAFVVASVACGFLMFLNCWLWSRLALARDDCQDVEDKALEFIKDLIASRNDAYQELDQCQRDAHRWRSIAVRNANSNQPI
jgi:hypothetical protein